MPPKAKSSERVKQEAEAQRARVAALQFLAKTGGGPSQKEIEQQQKDREKWTNTTSQAIQQKLAHLLPSAQSGQGNAPMRDNTLEAMAAQRARQMFQSQGGGDAAFLGVYTSAGTSNGNTMNGNGYRLAKSTVSGGGGGGGGDALSSGWKETRDPASGEIYYYNEVTKETSWDRPKEREEVAAGANDATGEDGALDDGWEEVQDPGSSATYYWNPTTNDTTWTKPVKQTVSLEQAREAKSRLDAILKICGPGTQSKASAKSTDVAKTAATTTQQAVKEGNQVSASAAQRGSSGEASHDSKKRGHVSDDGEGASATKTRRTDATSS